MRALTLSRDITIRLYKLLVGLSLLFSRVPGGQFISIE